MEHEDQTPVEKQSEGDEAGTRGGAGHVRSTPPLVRIGETEIRRLASSPVAELQRSIASQLARASVFQTSKWLEDVLPTRFELPALRFMANTSQALLGSTSLSGVFAAQEAARRVAESVAFTRDFGRQFGAAAATEAVRAQVLELTTVADLFSSFMSTLALATPPLLVERAVAVGSRGWDEATRLLLPAEDDDSLGALAGLGRGAAGIGASGLLLSDDEPDVEIEVPEWGPGPMHSRLREVLAELDTGLAARLDGAWERVSRPGPDAASQAAHSLMELIDWTLRLAAPDDVVVRWAHEEGREGELRDARPTRPLRLKYLLRNRPGEAKIARLYQRALADLVEAVQGLKHASGAKDREAVMSLLPTVEGLLYFALRRS